MKIAFANGGPRVTGSKFVVAPAADVKKSRPLTAYANKRFSADNPVGARRQMSFNNNLLW
jgi:hypothetical protein